MFVENPEVTLEDEGQGFPEGAGEFKGIEWTCHANAQGDDGRQYLFDCHIASYTSLGSMFPDRGALPAADMWAMSVRWEKGKVIQLPGSVYKLADFPQVALRTFQQSPQGALTIKRSDSAVALDFGDCHLVCRDDKTWHYSLEDKEQGIKAEWVHTAIGFPMWYHDKKKLEVYTPHSIAYGYHWAGRIEGKLIFGDRKVEIKGAAVRERYYAVDTCPAEVGGWHDWMWFHFDEMFGCLDEMKVSKHKVVSLYLLDEKRYLPDGNFNIEHHDWAYLRPIGAFIPTRYKVTVETEAGVLEMTANVVGGLSWGVTEVPDAPTTKLYWDKIDGTFTYKDGRKRTLTNGLGGTLIRQWKSYPDIFSPELFGEAPQVG